MLQLFVYSLYIQEMVRWASTKAPGYQGSYSLEAAAVWPLPASQGPMNDVYESPNAFQQQRVYRQSERNTSHLDAKTLQPAVAASSASFPSTLLCRLPQKSVKPAISGRLCKEAQLA